MTATDGQPNPTIPTTGSDDAPVDLAPVGIAYADAWGGVVYANARWREVLGCTGALPTSIDDLVDYAHPDDRAALTASFAEAIAGTEARLRFRSNPDRTVVAELAFAVRRLPRGSHPTARYVGVLTDVTEEIRALERVRQGEERFRAVTGALQVCVYRTDPFGTVIWVNGALSSMTGHHPTDVVGRSVLHLIHPDDREVVTTRALDAVASGGAYESEHRLVRPDGTSMWVLARSAPLLDHHGALVEHVGSIEDVTALRARSDALAHAAAHDPLTSLPNRTSLERHLRSLATDIPGRGDVGVVFVDLDGFKAVNDRHGHRVGDAVLIEVARRLSSATRGDDVVYRLAGDEFVIVCPGIAEPGDLHGVASRARTAVCGSPVDVDGRRHRVGASIGTALGPGGGPIEDLLHRADAAMYAQKRRNEAARLG